MRRYVRSVPVSVVMGFLVLGLTAEAGAQGKAQARSQGDARGRAEETLARHIEAIGGAPALRGITSRHLILVTRMKVIDTLPEIETRSEMFYQAPDMAVMRISMGKMGDIEMGFDGKTGWTRSDATGIERMDDAMARKLPYGVRPIPSYEPVKDVKFLGRRTFEGRQAVAVSFRGDDSGAMTIDYYDIASGLKLGNDAVPPAGAGATVRSVYEDYRWFGPERVAVMTRMLADGKPLGTVRITKVEHVALDASIFAAPTSPRKAP